MEGEPQELRGRESGAHTPGKQGLLLKDAETMEQTDNGACPPTPGNTGFLGNEGKRVCVQLQTWGTGQGSLKP